MDLIAAGCVWNSGNFIAVASVLIAEFERHAPTVLSHAMKALKESTITPNGRFLSAAFCDVDSVSFDHAVMEKTEKAQVLLSVLEWSDIGSWDSLHAVLDKDDNGNAFLGGGMSGGRQELLGESRTADQSRLAGRRKYCCHSRR